MSQWGESMLQWSWQSLLLILAMVIVARVLRFRSAADRYAFWLMGLAAVATLPVANAIVRTLPPVRIAVSPVPNVAEPIDVSSGPAMPVSPVGDVTRTGTTEPALRRPISWRPIIPVLFGVWCSGVAIYLCRSIRSWWQSRRLRRTAQPYPIGPSWRRIGYSTEVQAPVTIGVLRPMILLPADIRDWATPEEQRAVVLHELAHLERRDPIINLFQTLVGAVLFFHPAVRYALRRLALERELACDERVLNAGAQPSAYAGVLLKVAERSVARQETYQLAFNASGKILDRRVSMIFNYRSPISSGSGLIRTARAAAVLGLAILLLPQRSVTFEAHPTTFGEASPIAPPQEKVTVTSQRPVPIVNVAAVQAAAPAPVQIQPSNLSGRIYDQSGAMIPGVTVSLSCVRGNFAGGAAVFTDGTGAYQIPQVNPGQCTLSVSLPGFQPVSRSIIVRSGNPNIEDVILRLAPTTSVVEVSVSAPQVAVPRPPPTPPVRIGGSITAPSLISQVKPQYPAAAQAQGIQGFVQLLGVVDANGQVVSLQPDPSHGSGNFAMVQAAMDAVRQWRYRPALLNGAPIEFPMAITVNFAFQ